MHTRIHVSVALVALTLLAACGGGSSGPDAAVAPLNKFEEELVGSFSMTDFKLYAQGDQIYFPTHFAAAQGELILNADRTGSITLDLVGCTTGPDRTCGAPFTWKADSGLLVLTCATADEPDRIAEWNVPAMDRLSTRFFLPSPQVDCGLFLIDQGYESFDWARLP